MENQIKLPEELLLEIQSVRDQLTQNVIKIGRLNVQLSFYETDMAIVKDELKKLYQEAAEISLKEESIQNRVSTEYGSGKINFETGIFTKD